MKQQVSPHRAWALWPDVLCIVEVVCVCECDVECIVEVVCVCECDVECALYVCVCVMLPRWVCTYAMLVSPVTLTLESIKERERRERERSQSRRCVSWGLCGL